MVHSVDSKINSQKKSEHQIKAIIFDCDGTLIDSEHAHFHSWNAAFQNQGMQLQLEEYYTFIGRSFEAVTRTLIQRMGQESVERVLRDKVAHYHHLKRLGLPSIRHTVDFVSRLVEQKERLGLKFAVASAARKDEILDNLKILGIESVFDAVLSGLDDLSDYSDPEGVNKPKPYIYMHTAKQLGVTTDQCVVIEDSQPGVTAAVHAGCFTIAVPNEYTAFQDLSHAHLKIESFLGITPDALLETVTQHKKKIS